MNANEHESPKFKEKVKMKKGKREKGSDSFRLSSFAFCFLPLPFCLSPLPFRLVKQRRRC